MDRIKKTLKGRKNYFIRFIKFYARLRQLRYPQHSEAVLRKKNTGYRKINTLLVYCDNFDMC